MIATMVGALSISGGLSTRIKHSSFAVSLKLALLHPREHSPHVSSYHSRSFADFLGCFRVTFCCEYFLPQYDSIPFAFS